MKRIYFYLFISMAMLMLSVSSAWAQYVKLTAPDGTESWIEIEGTINGTNIEIYGEGWEGAIDKNTKGSIDLNEVWSRSGGRGTHYQVTSIGSRALYGCTGLTSIVIPSSVTSIGERAFLGCRGLTSIDIPNSVISIGDGAFYWCNNLTSITIPSSVTSIGNQAFLECTGLTSIVIPSSVTSIGEGTFHGCTGLTSITIGNGVTSIGIRAFQGCSALTSIVVEPGNSVFDSRNNCNAIIETATNTLIKGIKNTKIPSSVTSIGFAAFEGCRDLTSIYIPNSVTSIDRFAFYGCSGLTSIVIPSSVKSIGDTSFSHCTGLTSIVVESGNPVYDSRNNCNAIIRKATNALIAGCKNTIIPSSVTSIGSDAFAGCTGLTSLTIPEGVRFIGYLAFDGCRDLTYVSIPSSVTYIETGAFQSCSALTSVISYITEVFKTGDYAFSGCNNATLYVPKGLVDIYKSTSDWNRFTNIEEMIYKIPMTLACNSKGKVLVNGDIDFSNDVDHVDVIDGKDNTFEFIPNENCKLEQVIIDGFDVMSSVKDNKLTAKIRENSKMIVTFSKSSGDMNGDGMVNISDVVALVNLILGQ